MSKPALSEWRAGAGKSLREVAEALGIGGTNPGRTLHRYETGARACQLDLALRIEAYTAGAVTPGEMAAARAQYLSDHASPPSANPADNAAEQGRGHVKAAADALPVEAGR